MSAFGQIVSQGDHVVVSLVGEVDIESSAAFTALVDEALAASPHVVFDMAGVSFLDSSGLHVIALALKRVGDCGSVVVRNASTPVLRVMGVSGMDRVIAVDAGMSERAPG